MSITKSVDQTIDLTSARPPTIVEIFRRVLEVDDVTDDSDFFEVGGDSLLATRVLSAIAPRVRRGADLRRLRHRPEPRALAALVESLRP